jgi:hypothetical protein
MEAGFITDVSLPFLALLGERPGEKVLRYSGK